MTTTGIDSLIVNSPYTEPAHHWRYDPDEARFVLETGRRAAGYIMTEPTRGARGDSKRGDSDDTIRADRADAGRFEPLPLANKLRKRVGGWRRAGYPGVTGVTKRLLDHWGDRRDFGDHRFFFCQMEAVETLIWLLEAPEAERVGVEIPSDGSAFTRICSKMATGTGKTVVMAMLVAWHICNKITHPRDTRYSRNVLVIAPGLTVRSRLQVLDPHSDANYYEEFDIVPVVYRDKLRQGRVEIRNWHALQSETAQQAARRRGVDKRGPRSDEAFARDVLGDMAAARNLLVINDEAHHAWRIPPDASADSFYKEDREEATRWVEGLDRIHRTRGVLRCHDFTATPFVPAGKGKTSEGSERLFGWVVSDFGLNDAIESGLVKTPRVVVRDDAMPDAATYRSRMYHIYGDNSVKGDINRKADPEEPLPDLVRAAYRLLAHDWQATSDSWRELGHATDPVMISVTNRTETAARIKHAFDNARFEVPERLCDPNLTLHIDSNVLKKAETSEIPIADPSDTDTATTGSDTDPAPGGAARSKKPTKDQAAELLRRRVDTVGKPGEPGERIRHVISVAMLSEGWDAKTVTHVMGLRAFTSQLLCEQVIGRGLRRVSYDIDPATGKFEAEFVNVFGVPFAFLPQQDPGEAPKPPLPKTEIHPDPAKADLEIAFPNIDRVEHKLTPTLTLNPAVLDALTIDAAEIPNRATLAESLQGLHDETRDYTIDPAPPRLQRVLFKLAEGLYDRLIADQHRRERLIGNRAVLCMQLVRLLDAFVASDRLVIRGAGVTPKAVVIEQFRGRIESHVIDAIVADNVESVEPIFNTEVANLSTADMGRWWTGRRNGPAVKSHINRCVYDSALEEYVARRLDDSDLVEAWAKNDHLGFEVKYMHGGVSRRYIPDFLIRFGGDRKLVLEVKGAPLEIDASKEKYLRDWVTAVNTHGGYGVWSCAMYHPDSSDPDRCDLDQILADHASADHASADHASMAEASLGVTSGIS